MNIIDMDSLYIAKIVIDMILVLYVLVIYRRFRHYSHGLCFLVYSRLGVFAGFFITYLHYRYRFPILSFIGNGLLIISSALFIYFLSVQLKQPYRINLHIGLFTAYIVLFSYSVMTLNYIFAGSIIISLFAVIQFLVFLIDYYRGKVIYYRFIAICLIPFTLIHLSRVMEFLQNPFTIYNPLDGNLFSALILIMFMLLDMVITLAINTQIHKRKLFKNL